MWIPWLLGKKFSFPMPIGAMANARRHWEAGFRGLWRDGPWFCIRITMA